MGGAPIFIDDGGSIRLALKDPNSNGEMETLFEVDTSHQSKHEITHPAGQSYSKVRIFWLDKSGYLKLTTPVTYPCKSVTVSSHVDMKIKAQIIEGQNKVKLTVFHDKVDPVFASKQHRNKRSYTILNGGRIKKIEVPDPLIPNKVRSVTIPDSALYAGLVIT